VRVKAEPKGKKRATGEKTAASDEGANWLKEAWRKAGFTPFIGSTIAAEASALGLRASAVMTAPRPAPVYFIIAAHATYHNECLENKSCCAFGGEVCGSCCIVAFP
jgi:hypothetical protein